MTVIEKNPMKRFTWAWINRKWRPLVGKKLKETDLFHRYNGVKVYYAENKVVYIELEEELVGQNFELKQPLGIGSTFESVVGILGNPTYTLNSWISYAFEITNGN